MLELRSTYKKYLDGKGGTSTALDGVSVQFAPGGLTVILGPSGSGKSTLLRLFNRMVEPDAGAVFVNGKDVRALNPVNLRRGMGYVIQSVGLFPHMSVAENIGVVPRLLGWNARSIGDRTAELLDLVRLPPSFAHRKPHQLSGGEAQRVGVARALAADPPVLLMDEPFGALDAFTREALQGEFLRIQKELRKTVLFVTHDVAEAVRLADRLVVMQSGRIAGDGTPGSLAGTLQGSYIHEFLGSRLGIELLARIPAVDRADFTDHGAGRKKESAATADIDILDPQATLLDALSRMVTRGAGSLYVRREDGAIGRIDFSALIQPDSTEPGA